MYALPRKTRQGRRGAPGVKTTGCSGLAYKLGIRRRTGARRHRLRSHGVKVLVDTEEPADIDGTELDFVREGLNEGFKFRNPRRRTAAARRIVPR